MNRQDEKTLDEFKSVGALWNRTNKRTDIECCVRKDIVDCIEYMSIAIRHNRHHLKMCDDCHWHITGSDSLTEPTVTILLTP